MLDITHPTCPQFVLLHLSDGLTKFMTWQHDLNVVIEPFSDGSQHRHAFGLSSFEPIFDADVLVFLFHLVELIN